MFVPSTPEEGGLPSRAVESFVGELEKYAVNMHGFSLSRGNRILAEGYWKPFHREFQHRMYSVGKSFVSLAVGLLREEGKLSLEDRICSHFPECLPGTVHPWIGAMTIGDMLTMRTAHASTTYKRYGEGNWVESFFRVPPSYHPGSFFAYDTSASHVLAALVEKLSAMKLLDYLRKRVFDRTGMSRDARILPDPWGVSQGGSGLVCTLEDMRSAGYLFLSGGEWEGEQLLPRDYLAEALTKQADTSFRDRYDERWGYGYQVWKTRHDGFALYGLGGQLILGLPRTGLMLATMADTQGDQYGTDAIHRAFWDTIVPALAEGPLPENRGEQERLARRLGNLRITLPDTGHPPLPRIEGMTGTLTSEELTGKLGIPSLHLTREGDNLVLRYTRSGEERTLPFGLYEPAEGLVEVGGQDRLCYAYLSVLDDGVIRFTVKVIGDLFGEIRALAALHDGEITLRVNTYGESVLESLNGFCASLKRRAP